MVCFAMFWLNPGWKNFEKISEHQRLTFELTFKRDMSGHLMHFYLPSIILCASSLMSLFIPSDLLPARMSLAATTCLSMITLVVGAKYVNSSYVFQKTNFVDFVEIPGQLHHTSNRLVIGFYFATSLYSIVFWNTVLYYPWLKEAPQPKLDNRFRSLWLWMWIC